MTACIKEKLSVLRLVTGVTLKIFLRKGKICFKISTRELQCPLMFGATLKN